jgi:basic membrane protein A
MKKRILALLLASVMLFALTACSGGAGNATPAPTPTPTPAPEGVTLDNIKVGFVHISDPSDKGYTYNHDLGTQRMKAALGLRDDQVISKYNVPESAECDTAIRELVEAGCSIIFCTSFGFEDYMLAVAAEYPDVEFCHAPATRRPAPACPTFTIISAIFLRPAICPASPPACAPRPISWAMFPPCPSPNASAGIPLSTWRQERQSRRDHEGHLHQQLERSTAEAAAAQALIDAGCDVIGQHADSTATQTTAQANGVWAWATIPT